MDIDFLASKLGRNPREIESQLRHLESEGVIARSGREVRMANAA